MKFLNYNVNKSNIFKFLTPTTKGTKWYEPAPENKLNKRLVGRFLLQFHQVAEEIYIEKKNTNLKFLDVGTGNGLLPEMISKS